MPYFEQTAVYDQIQAGDPAGGVAPGGPQAWNDLGPWLVAPAAPGSLRCPSDPNARSGTRDICYAMSLGDTIFNVKAKKKDFSRAHLRRQPIALSC
jgi:hypothetical protein